MTKKMIIGTTLIIIGATSMITGFVFIKNETNSPKVIQNNDVRFQNISQTNDSTIGSGLEEKKDIETETKVDFKSKSETLENLIILATADGQLTNNEEKLLRDKAIELGLAYENYANKISQLLEKNQLNKETNIIDKDKEKGDLFEKFIVQKFSKKYFNIQQWAGDKFIDGKYAETTLQPDLVINFKLKDISEDFAIECKYRSNYYNGRIEWCSIRQWNNYIKFESEKNIRVFIAIGVSGTANNPDELFLIPLDKIKGTSLSRDFLALYKKSNFKEHQIFFDYKNSLLQ